MFSVHVIYTSWGLKLLLLDLVEYYRSIDMLLCHCTVQLALMFFCKLHDTVDMYALSIKILNVKIFFNMCMLECFSAKITKIQ